MTAAGVRDDHFLLLRCHNDNREALRTKFLRSTLSVKCKHNFSKNTKSLHVVKSKRLLFFLFVFFKDYWTLPLLPLPPKRQPNKFAKCFFPRFLNLRWRQWSATRSQRARKNKEEEKERVSDSLPLPLAVFPVRISLYRSNNLDAWKHFTLCALCRKNLLVNVFRNFILKKV